MKLITFKHSGNAGDIIYSLSSIMAICMEQGARAVIYIKLGVPSTFTEKTHPTGNVMMNSVMYDMLYPLLMDQPYIANVEIHNGEPVDYDLDLFRKDYKNLSAGNIQSWYSNSYPELRPVLHEANLFVRPRKTDYIIVNRTSRYNNVYIDYSVLREYDNVYFVGVESEYKAMALHYKKLEHLKVNDFLELAEYIAGCRLFIGNQSMAFSIAEQLKVKRILEQYIPAPNVIPQGGEYYVTHNMEQFKKSITFALHGKNTDTHTTQREQEIGQSN